MPRATAAAGDVAAAWTEHLDAASGRVYYYNPSTGAKSWTKPEAQAQAQATPPATEPKPAATVATAGPVATVENDAAQSTWTSIVDPGSGQTCAPAAPPPPPPPAASNLDSKHTQVACGACPRSA